MTLEKEVTKKCPRCGDASRSVSLRTLGYHLREEQIASFDGETVYSCRNPSCDVAYFSTSTTLLGKHTLFFAKKAQEKMICFCCNVNYQEFHSHIERGKGKTFYQKLDQLVSKMGSNCAKKTILQVVAV